MVWILPKRLKRRDSRIHVELLINGRKKRRSALSWDEIECKLTQYGAKQGVILDLNGLYKQEVVPPAVNGKHNLMSASWSAAPADDSAEEIECQFSDDGAAHKTKIALSRKRSFYPDDSEIMKKAELQLASSSQATSSFDAEGRDEEPLKEACSSREEESLPSESREHEEVELDFISRDFADVMSSGVALQSIASCAALDLHSLPTIEEEDEGGAEKSQDKSWIIKVVEESKVDASYMLQQTTSLLNAAASETYNACSKVVDELESQRSIHGVEDLAGVHNASEAKSEKKPNTFNEFVEEVSQGGAALMHETQSLLSVIASKARKVASAIENQKSKLTDAASVNPVQVEDYIRDEKEDPSEAFESLRSSSTSNATTGSDATQSGEVMPTMNGKSNTLQSEFASEAKTGLRRVASLGPMVFTRKSSKKNEKEQSIGERQSNKIVDVFNDKKASSGGKGLRRVVSLGTRVFPSTRTSSTRGASKGKDELIDTGEESIEFGLSRSSESLILPGVEQAKKPIGVLGVSKVSESEVGNKEGPSFQLGMRGAVSLSCGDPSQTSFLRPRTMMRSSSTPDQSYTNRFAVAKDTQAEALSGNLKESNSFDVVPLSFKSVDLPKEGVSYPYDDGTFACEPNNSFEPIASSMLASETSEASQNEKPYGDIHSAESSAIIDEFYKKECTVDFGPINESGSVEYRSTEEETPTSIWQDFKASLSFW